MSDTGRTYEELLNDQDYMQNIFVEIGKIKEIEDGIRDKFALEGTILTDENLKSLKGLYADVQAEMEKMDENQLNAVAAGLDSVKNLANGVENPEIQKQIGQNLIDAGMDMISNADNEF